MSMLKDIGRIDYVVTQIIQHPGHLQLKLGSNSRKLGLAVSLACLFAM